MRLFSTFVVGCCAALAASQAFGSLVIDLRFTDGSTTKNISAMSPGQTVTIQVWATITGTDADHTNDGLTFAYFGLLSANADTAHLAGNLTNASVVLPPFTDAITFNPGTFGDRNADTIGDWRGTTADSPGFVLPPGWPKASFALSSRQFGGDGVGQAVGPNGWAFHIADAVFQIGSIDFTGIAGTQSALTYDPVIPNPALPSGRASWAEDGVNKFGSDGPTLGTSVTFELSSVPEPSSFALASAGIICAACYGWRRRKRQQRTLVPI